jgi:hypothetical protein
VPSASDQPYDVRHAIQLIADPGSFLEVQAEYAYNVVVGFARLAGSVVAFSLASPALASSVVTVNSGWSGLGCCVSAIGSLLILIWVISGWFFQFQDHDCSSAANSHRSKKLQCRHNTDSVKHLKKSQRDT